MKVAIFFDGKNYYSGWQEHTGGQPIDFVKLSHWLTERVGGTYLWGSYYYTGVERDTDGAPTARLEKFLDDLERKPGFFVRRLPRRQRRSHCDACGADTVYTEEKQVDTTMVADIVRLAAAGAYDIAILLSGDSDYAPAMEAVRLLGKQAYVATWAGVGLSSEMRRVAFDHLDLTEAIEACADTGYHETAVAALAAAEDPEAAAAFLEEVRRAEQQFVGGYVGVNFFLTKWRSLRLDPSPVVRQQLLNRLVEDGTVEVYEVESGEKAMRSVGGPVEGEVPQE